MFSKRTSWHQETNRLTALAVDLRRQGKPVIDLTGSNPTECGIIYPQAEILAAFQSADILHYRPDPRGLLSARSAVADYYSRLNVPIAPDDIFLQASTSEGYATAFKVLCNPGDTVLIPRPSYPLFEYLAELNDVHLAPYPLRYDGEWHVDLAALRGIITPGTKAIIIVNPHNPTGTFLKAEELHAINAMAREHNLALIVDEVFIDYGFPGSIPVSTAGNTAALTFTLNGISKTLALPQMKLGWIALSGPGDILPEARHRLETVCDTYLSVNTPVQVALPALLKACEPVRHAIRERTAHNYQALQAAFRSSSSPCSVLAAEGGWYGLLTVPRTKSDEEWCITLLQEQGVLLYPGYFFDFDQEGILVVSLLTEEHIFSSGLQRLRTALS